MLKLFNRKKKDNKGFTLVELVVVIAILAILVGLLAPQYTKYVEKSRKSADVTNIENVVTAIKVAASDEEFGSLTTGNYEVKLTTNGLTVTAPDKSELADDGALKKALDEYMGTSYTKNDATATFANVVRKSSKWKADKGCSTDDPAATANVTTTGAVNVTYDPVYMAK